MKRVFTALLIAAVVAALAGSAALACGKDCPMKAANKGGCAMGAKNPAMEAMDKAFTALQADLAKMDKGVPAAEQAAFLTASQGNLKSLMAAKADCEKSCKMHEEKPKDASMKPCAHQEAMKTGMKALSDDLAKMEKGIPAADQAAFLKAYQGDLKKVIDSHDACMKECKAKAAAKTDKT